MAPQPQSPLPPASTDSPHDAVARFALAVAAIDALQDSQWQALLILQAEAEIAVLSAAHAAKLPPRQRQNFRAAMIAGHPAVKATWQDFIARADALAAQQRQDLLSAESAARDAADTIPAGAIPRSHFLRPPCHATVQSYQYTSMGFGAMKYARAAAENLAARARRLGIPAEVHLLESHYVPGFGCGITHGTYGVFADCDLLGWRAAESHSPPPLREQVRRAWASGANPRVTMPFLPHGYEESVGLNFFGGELAAAVSARNPAA